MTKTIGGTDLQTRQSAPLRLAAELARQPRNDPPTVTWLNHWSVERAEWTSLRKMTHVGVDGTYLQLLLRSTGSRVERTSADLVLPLYLELVGDARVALIGAAPGVAEAAAARLSGVVFVADGFDGLASLLTDPTGLRASAPTAVVLGLGAGLQDRTALRIRALLPDAAVFTAGGWIDQLAASSNFFPAVVHQLRVGWLRRLLREPRRLIRRYTTDAVVSALTFRSRSGPQIDRHLRSTGTLGWAGRDAPTTGRTDTSPADTDAVVR